MKQSKLLVRAWLLFIGYCTLSAVVYVPALLLLQKGILLHVPWILSVEKSLSQDGFGNPVSTWLRPGCIEYDPELIYRPVIGTCQFNEIEFNTSLTFTDEGRVTGDRPAGTGIAVIGDSHAMGWGVNDQQAFPAVLQRLSGRPVYNLGVASYGTVRELIRLEQSGLADRIDTVIIQYCNNDLPENLRFDTASKKQLYDRIFGQFTPHAAAGKGREAQTGKVLYILKGYWSALDAPLRSLADRLRRKNFEPHYGPLIATLGKHAAVLRGKRVIVFYSNSRGQKYRNFPSGRDPQIPDVYFVDLDLGVTDYYNLDNHPTPAGQKKIAERLYAYLQQVQPPAPGAGQSGPATTAPAGRP
jgi:lysophospholipase L1-like esterase